MSVTGSDEAKTQPQQVFEGRAGGDTRVDHLNDRPVAGLVRRLGVAPQALAAQFAAVRAQIAENGASTISIRDAIDEGRP